MEEIFIAHSGYEKYIQCIMGTSNGKRTLRRARYRWEVNIKMYLKDMGCIHADLGPVVQDDGPLDSLKWGKRDFLTR
jgi:hypothetical protein